MIIATRKIQNENENCHQENSFWQSLRQKPQRLLLHTTSLRGRWCHIFGWCQSFLTSQLKMSSRILCYIEKQYLQNFKIKKKIIQVCQVWGLDEERHSILQFSRLRSHLCSLCQASHMRMDPTPLNWSGEYFQFSNPRKWDLLPNQAAHQYWELSLPPI